MGRTLLLGCLLFLSSSGLLGQVHRFPAHGGEGVPGTVPFSYALGWSKVPGALGYEYVISDNPLCFAGCTGDTRQQYVRDTAVVEFNFQPEKWYYWITRIHEGEQDTSEWSLISSFFTRPANDAPGIVNVAPNPVGPEGLHVRLDWAQNPLATAIDFSLRDLQGRILVDWTHHRLGAAVLRFEEVTAPPQELGPGWYFLQARVRSSVENTNNLINIKILVL